MRSLAPWRRGLEKGDIAPSPLGEEGWGFDFLTTYPHPNPPPKGEGIGLAPSPLGGEGWGEGLHGRSANQRRTRSTWKR
jgi:hypothetical protein